MNTRPVVCIGAALVDESFVCKAVPVAGTSNPAAFYKSPGGVARNVAHHLGLLGHPVQLVTHVGNDGDGQWLLQQCHHAGIQTQHALVNDAPTGRFAAMLAPNGELFAGAACSVLEEQLTPAFLETQWPLLQTASLVMLDCNLSRESLHYLLSICRRLQLPTIVETVSVPKAERLRHADVSNVLLLTPNRDELSALTGDTDPQRAVEQLLQRGVQYVWLRNGKDGSTLFGYDTQYHLPAPPVNVTDTTGAGDAALAGWIHAHLQHKNPDICTQMGHALAALILQTPGAILPALTADLLAQTHQTINTRTP